jgi:hypothetical protein
VDTKLLREYAHSSWKLVPLIIVSWTNPEGLILLPWKDKDLAWYGGLPSIRAVLMCTIATTLENVPQFTIQFLTALRNGWATTAWHTKASMSFSVGSLVFRMIIARFLMVCLDMVDKKEGRHKSSRLDAQIRRGRVSTEDVVSTTPRTSFEVAFDV